MAILCKSSLRQHLSETKERCRRAASGGKYRSFEYCQEGGGEKYAIVAGGGHDEGTLETKHYVMVLILRKGSGVTKTRKLRFNS